MAIIAEIDFLGVLKIGSGIIILHHAADAFEVALVIIPWNYFLAILKIVLCDAADAFEVALTIIAGIAFLAGLKISSEIIVFYDAFEVIGWVVLGDWIYNFFLKFN